MFKYSFIKPNHKTVMQLHLPGAHHIADYLLATAKLDYGMDLDQLQLNKLCYLVNGFVLQERDDPAFYNNVEAWKYGPVIPDVYIMYKVYGDHTITHLDICRTPLGNHAKITERRENLAEIIGDDVAGIADSVLKEYGKYDGSQLVDMTYQSKTPWKKAYKPGYNKTITAWNIRKFYRKLTVDSHVR